MPRRKLLQTAAARKARAYYRKNRERILRKRRAPGKRKKGSGVYANWLRKQKGKKGSGMFVNMFENFKKNRAQDEYWDRKRQGLKSMRARVQQMSKG